MKKLKAMTYEQIQNLKEEDGQYFNFKNDKYLSIRFIGEGIHIERLKGDHYREYILYNVNGVYYYQRAFKNDKKLYKIKHIQTVEHIEYDEHKTYEHIIYFMMTTDINFKGYAKTEGKYKLYKIYNVNDFLNFYEAELIEEKIFEF